MVVDFVVNAVFKSRPMETHEQDRACIVQLGGPSKVAELLDLPKKGGAQRVQNWLTRGIPAAIKVAHPNLFMPELKANSPALANAAPGASESVAGQGG